VLASNRIAYTLYIVLVFAFGFLFGIIGSLIVIVIGGAVIYLQRRRATPSTPPALQAFIRTGDPALDDYVSIVSTRLSKQRFQVERNVMAGKQNVTLYATLRRFELSKLGIARRVVAVLGSNAVTQESVKRVIDSLSEFSREGSFAGVMANQSSYLFVVIVSRSISDDLKAWVIDAVGNRGWMAFSLPVLVSLSERKVYYSMKTPTFGAVYYRGMRKFAGETFAF
jgi:hypothetical protein